MMKTQSIFSSRGALGCVAVLVFGLFASALATGQQLSDADNKAMAAIQAAPDIAAKLAAGEAFVKATPKSAARPRIADYLVEQIDAVPDATLKLTLAQRFQKTFTQTAELNAIKPVEIDALILQKKVDEAFSLGASFLSKSPDDIQALTDLAIAGVDQAKQKNPKYANDASQYGTKAIELMEANKQPAGFDDATWTKYKAVKLPQLYQAMAIISLMKQDGPGAKAKLEKAITLNPADPYNYVLHGSLVNDEYQRLAQTFKTLPEGKAKTDTLNQAMSLMDKVVDDYAKAVALSEGKESYKKLHDDLLPDLKSYYAFRHNGSTDGMQKLIDGYKGLAAPTATP
jgi:hypothetical protein